MAARTRFACGCRTRRRRSLDAIQNTVFNSATGTPRRSARWRKIEQLPPQNEIRRENLQQLVVVTARLEGSDLGTAIKKVQQVVEQLHLPPSVRVEYGGTYQEQQKSFHELLRVLLLALVLVFGVLLAEFRNFAAPMAILTSSVLSISGVVLALLITRTDFNVASFMGLIMVIGIVAKNGILLLDADEKFRARGRAAARSDAAGGAAAAAAHRDDGDGGDLRHVAAGVRTGRGIADAAAAGDRGDRRPADLDGAEPDRDAGDVLPDDTPSPRRGLEQNHRRGKEHAALGASVRAPSFQPGTAA